MPVKTIETTPFQDQKPGTSGLRKKVKVFQQPNYVENFVQATFNALAEEGGIPEVITVGGDGRYLSDVVCDIICRMALANGVKTVLQGEATLMSTPAASALIRTHSLKPGGGFILTASHNPGGPENDFGIKYNCANGGPAPEKLTNKIFEKTKSIASYQIVQDEEVKPQMVDTVAVYAAMVKDIFDCDKIAALIKRKDFTLYFDGLNGVAGPYARRVLVDMLGASPDSLHNCEPKNDFGGLHPDPNLTYAEELVAAMGLTRKGEPTVGHDKPVPTFGAACDGDADRNMILGARFFVSPSDSVAVLAANAQECIPFFRDGLKGVARSMPTSRALDLVAKELNVPSFEVPTGWKFFGNLMDSACDYGKQDYTPFICGEESFGTGSNHVREKDGLWAVLAWLNVLAVKNASTKDGELVTVKDIVEEHWRKYGRNYYCRYDYEGVSTEGANKVMDHVRNLKPEQVPPMPNRSKVATIDDFEYHDPVDGSISKNQGLRVIYEDGSRFVLRLSGTGSEGATIRLYLEEYVRGSDAASMLARPEGMPTSGNALAAIAKIAVDTARIEEFTGRNEPTVIT